MTTLDRELAMVDTAVGVLERIEAVRQVVSVCGPSLDRWNLLAAVARMESQVRLDLEFLTETEEISA